MRVPDQPERRRVSAGPVPRTVVALRHPHSNRHRGPVADDQSAVRGERHHRHDPAAEQAPHPGDRRGHREPHDHTPMPHPLHGDPDVPDLRDLPYPVRDRARRQVAGYTRQLSRGDLHRVVGGM